MISKKNHSIPKLYTGGVDVSKWAKLTKAEKELALSRPWYVRWSYRNPETGHLERQGNIKGGANHYKTKSERMEVLDTYRTNLLRLLKEGFSPYDIVDTATDVQEALMAVDHALGIKKGMMAKPSFSRYLSRVNGFRDFLSRKGYGKRFITSVDRKLINEFLNEELKRTSPRNRNNSRTALMGLFQVMADNELITSNPVSGIRPLKSTPTRNKSFMMSELERINRYMESHNPNLKLFTQFVSYNFLRPIEVVRLRVRDIDIEGKILNVRAKNQNVKRKIIPDILLREIPDLSHHDKNMFLFTQHGGPGLWYATDENRRSSMGKQFAVVKDALGFGNEYGLYSFRHTYIGIMYAQLRDECSPFEAKSRLMLITGHSTMTALEKYLRDIDAELPEDYSKYLG